MPARMPLPPWLDRIWLGLIALAFLVMVPIWLIIHVERYGLAVVLAVLLAALLLRRATS
jgi:hypothetical protein